MGIFLSCSCCIMAGSSEGSSTNNASPSFSYLSNKVTFYSFIMVKLVRSSFLRIRLLKEVQLKIDIHDIILWRKREWICWFICVCEREGGGGIQDIMIWRKGDWTKIYVCVCGGRGVRDGWKIQLWVQGHINIFTMGPCFSNYFYLCLQTFIALVFTYVSKWFTWRCVLHGEYKC